MESSPSTSKGKYREGEDAMLGEFTPEEAIAHSGITDSLNPYTFTLTG